MTSAELEHPQSVDRRTLFRAYMRRLDPKADPAIALRDGSYVLSPHATSSHIATRLEIDPTSSHLIIGAVGSGKTTELLAINERVIQYMTGLVDAYSRGENWEVRPAAVTRRRAQIVDFAI